ncbi:hypothetical protein [Tahibacter caeni]|uniref:hypothetical protein n=1 Tax=Tahibacter caeni TaxID=1453545 RepID=UPI00214921B5|nr:hypothetical protein [Tahibacter caeni]
MPQDYSAVRPGAVGIGGWIVDGLILLALCIAAVKGHRAAFGLFALFAVAGLATRVHWAGAHVVPNGWRVLAAPLYLSSTVLLVAAAFCSPDRLWTPRAGDSSLPARSHWLPESSAGVLSPLRKTRAIRGSACSTRYPVIGCGVR